MKKRGPEPVSLDLVIDDWTERTCRWPTGYTGARMHACGHPKPLGKPYCAYHMKSAYREGTAIDLEAYAFCQ